MRALAILALVSGCAWGFQERVTAKAKAGREPVACSTSRIPRALDVVAVVADAIAAGVILGHYSHDARHEGLGAGLIVAGSLHVGSFFLGNEAADTCRRYGGPR